MDFLNSDAFLQMAREYNKKYSVNSYATVLNTKNEFLQDAIKEIFVSVFKLHNNLKVTFKKYKQFSAFFSNAESFLQEIKNFYEENFNEKLDFDNCELVKPVNHKYCAVSMLNIYISIFKVNAEIITEVDKLKNGLLLDSYNSSNIKQLNLLGDSGCDSFKGKEINVIIKNNELLADKNKKDIESLIEKLYKLQEIFLSFTENLKDFYIKIN